MGKNGLDREKDYGQEGWYINSGEKWADHRAMSTETKKEYEVTAKAEPIWLRKWLDGRYRGGIMDVNTDA